MRVEIKQKSEDGREFVFFIHKDFEHYHKPNKIYHFDIYRYEFSLMSYELLDWTIENRCNLCSKEKECAIKKLTCYAAAENYPFHSVRWLIIAPISFLKWSIRKKLPKELVHCLEFDSIQTSLFEIDSSEQQNIMLSEMLLQAENKKE